MKVNEKWSLFFNVPSATDPARISHMVALFFTNVPARRRAGAELYGGAAERETTDAQRGAQGQVLKVPDSQRAGH